MKIIKLILIIGIVSCFIINCGGKAKAEKKEAGEEHADKEHVDKEHAGEEHAGESAKSYSAKQIKEAMNEYIQSETKKNDGVFIIEDKKTSKTLKLKFVKIHDPVRKIEGKGYFACTDFYPSEGPEEKLYDLDFWLNPKEGKLMVTKSEIHKHPVLENDLWVKKARYTFIDDKPVEIK